MTIASTDKAPVGYFVVGDGKFGKFYYGKQFVPLTESPKYYQARGYEFVPVFVENIDMDHFDPTQMTDLLKA